MKNQKKAYIFAFAAVGFWSTVASAFKLTLAYISPEILLFYSSLFSLIILAVILVMQRKSGLFLSSTIREIAYSALLGFLNPFLYYMILFKAYSLLPAQEAMTLNYVWPIMLMFLSVPILKERLSLLSVVSAIISFSGVIIIAAGGNLRVLHFSDPAGVSLALSSSLVWALFWLAGVRDKRDGTVRLLMNFIFGFAYIAIYNVFSGNISLPALPALGGSLYIGIFEMGITFVAWSLALRYAESTASVSTLIFLTPFISLLIISIIVGESIKTSTITGLVLIIAGIMIQQYFTDIRKE